MASGTNEQHGNGNVYGDGSTSTVTGSAFSNTGSVSAPALSESQRTKALELAASQYGTREYNLIKTLNVNVGAVLDGPVEVIKNVTAILRKIVGA
jgi:hypothetical protein